MKDGIVGAVMTIQTIGNYAKWYLHIHAIVVDGLFLFSERGKIMNPLTIGGLIMMSRSGVAIEGW